MRSKERKYLLIILSRLIRKAYQQRLPQGADYFAQYFGLGKEQLIQHFLDQAKELGFKPNQFARDWTIKALKSLAESDSVESFLSLENVTVVRCSAPVVLGQEQRESRQAKVLGQIVGRGFREAILVKRNKSAQSRANFTEKQSISAISLQYSKENKRIMRGLMHDENIRRSNWSQTEYYWGFYLRD